MKITLINTFYYPDEPGGAERSVRLLAEGLRTVGHEVMVICLGNTRETIVHNGVCVERLQIRNNYLPTALEAQPNSIARTVWHLRDIWNSKAAEDVEAVLTRFSPNVLHSNNLSGFSVSVWTAAARLGIPVVHTVRDFYLMCPKTTMMKGKNSCSIPCKTCLSFALPRRADSNKVSHVVGISNFILKRHLDYGCFKGVPASVIYNSFDAPLPSYRAPGNEIQIGYIGRLVPAKGVELLLDAFAHSIAHSDIKARLLIAGDGRKDYVDTLKQKAKNMPVTFLGYVSPNEFFPRVDITVVPSIWNEPLGRVVIESFAFGKPVIVMPVGGLPELIAGPEGIVTKAVTFESLRTSLNSMAGQLRDSPSHLYLAAVERAKNFTRSEITKQYAAVFERCVNESSYF